MGGGPTGVSPSWKRRGGTSARRRGVCPPPNGGALTAAIDELPAGSRTMLVLRDVEGLSNVEIAEVLGFSVPVVKTRVHRARLFLRKQLGDVMTTLDAPRATQPARE